MKLAILNAKIAIRRAPAKLEEKTAGGIIKPHATIKRKNEGVVVGIGPQCCDVQKGDIVVFGAWAGEEFNYDGETIIMMDQHMIYAVKRKEADDNDSNITSLEAIREAERREWPDCFTPEGEILPQPDPPARDLMVQSYE